VRCEVLVPGIYKVTSGHCISVWKNKLKLCGFLPVLAAAAVGQICMVYQGILSI